MRGSGRARHPFGVLEGVVVSILGGECKPTQDLESRLLEISSALSHLSLEHLLVATHRLLGFLASSDVARDCDELSLVGIRARHPLQPAIAAVLMPVAVREMQDGLARLRLPLGLGDCRLAIVGVHESLGRARP